MTYQRSAWRLGRGKVTAQRGHQLVLLEGGEAFFPALIEAMDAARRVVHLETYIFEFAGSALGVAEALERAAARGVLVRLVVDGVGTPRLPDEWAERFGHAGVHWQVYSPLGRMGLLIPNRWRRLHRKLCVIDETVGFCGGINIIDDRNDGALGALIQPRLDFSLLAVGPLVGDMVDSMEQLWWRLQTVRKTRQREFKAAWTAMKEVLPLGDFSGLSWSSGEQTMDVASDGLHTEPGLPGMPLLVDDAVAALILRDNVSHRHDIERAYLKAIGESREDIVIANAYFVPGRKLRRALIFAARRGVRVRLLLQGRYENFFQYHAARPVFQTLVDAGIDIRSYAPSALHAKVAVVDQRWATVGSTNLDPLSLLLAREANVVTSDIGFARLLHERLDLLVTRYGEPIDARALRERPWRQRALDRVAFGLMRAMLFLSGHRY